MSDIPNGVCRSCGGHGHIHTSPGDPTYAAVECEACSGTGKLTVPSPLTKARVALMFRVADETRASFATNPNGFDETIDDYFEMRLPVWEDMGRPDWITMTIEPGDLLNPRKK